MVGNANTKGLDLDKLSSRILTILLVIFVVYAAYLSAQFAWFVVARNAEPQAVLALPAQKATTKKVHNRKADELSRYHLFGKPGVKTRVQPQVVQEAPKTTLRLVLKGVFTGEKGAESGAIIEEIGKKTDYYRIDDKVAGNAVLAEVYHDRVLLRRNGRLETLSFVEKKAVKSGGIAKVKPKPKNSSSQSERIESPEQFLEVATERLTNDPEQALQSVGLAAKQGGGYEYQGNNPMLAGLNLQKGDVILSVNGHTLGDVKRDKELMASLYEQGSVEVEVVRDGASFYINYPLR